MHCCACRPLAHDTAGWVRACRTDSSALTGEAEDGSAGMSQSEVAAQLGVSQQSVSQLVQEAVHELRRAAQEQRLASKLHLG